jgi:signal transduction histidine kinase
MILLNKAREIAEKYSPDRVFDIDTRRTLSYYTAGDIPKFLEGYKAYREGVAEGKSSVHGRTMEVYYLATQGKTDEAVALARKELSDDRHEVITKIYEKAGRWKEAYESLHKSYSASDSVNNVALANSMTGIRDQLAINDMERASIRNRMIALIIGLILLALLVVALIYIVQSRRRHLTQLKNAYQHALESDKMKTSFIQNVTHEVRTPLNIISGFAQVIADPELTKSDKERQHMAEMMQKSATQITKLIDEIIGLSLIETSSTPPKEDTVNVHQLMQEAIDENRSSATKDTELRLESELPDDFCIKTNKIIVSRVISALTDNAVKYTERGSVTLRANADDKTLNIAIEDTGCGVPAEEAENIFGRFVKLDSFKEGLGLGLPLSRKLAEQIGSTVTLDTSYHPGARFVVTIPIDSSEK